MSGHLCHITRAQVGGGYVYLRGGCKAPPQLASSKCLPVGWVHTAASGCETWRERETSFQFLLPSLSGLPRPSMEEDKLFIGVSFFWDPTAAAGHLGLRLSSANFQLYHFWPLVSFFSEPQRPWVWKIERS